MVQVNADPQDYLRLARQIAQTKKDINNLAEQLKSRSRSLHLNDPVAKRLQDTLASTVSAISAKTRELDAIEVEAKKRAGQLDSYLR